MRTVPWGIKYHGRFLRISGPRIWAANHYEGLLTTATTAAQIGSLDYYSNNLNSYHRLLYTRSLTGALII